MKLSVLKIPGKENALRIIVDGWKARSDPVRYTLQTDRQDGTAARERAIPPERSIEDGVLSFEASDVGVAYESGFADARIDIIDEEGTQYVGSGRAEPPGHLDGAARSAVPTTKSQIGADIVVSGHGEAVAVDPLALNAVSPADYVVVLGPGSGARVTGPPEDPHVSVPIRRGAASEVAYSLQPREGGSPIAGTITASHRRAALSGLYLACLPLLLLVGMLASLLQGPIDFGGGADSGCQDGCGRQDRHRHMQPVGHTGAASGAARCRWPREASGRHPAAGAIRGGSRGGQTCGFGGRCGRFRVAIGRGSVGADGPQTLSEAGRYHIRLRWHWPRCR